MKSLFEEVRSEQNIFSAWRHVKSSALASANPDIRGMASEFEHSHQRHLKRVIAQLRAGRFTFDPVEGVLKDKRKRLAQNKQPRPIAIATLKNRIVQRAILQVLQPREIRDARNSDPKYAAKVDARLGRINEVNRSQFGVGGLIYPYGGVRPAIQRIMQAMNDGAKYFYQSDIEAFFTKIPTVDVVNFIRNETGDEDLTDLFSEALKVHLANADELEGYAQLFPNGGIGVAQGSSLSAFAGNVLLFAMDHELNTGPVTAVRYIDDILIVADQEVHLEQAVETAKARLSAFKFGLYSPSDSNGKAAKGECRNSINFLGCSLQPKRCVPNAESIKKLHQAVSQTLASSRKEVHIAMKKGGRIGPKVTYSATLETVGKKVFGWQKSFDFCSEEQPFKSIDKFVYDEIENYGRYIARMLRKADQETKMMVLGVPSTLHLFRAGLAKK
ncbi:MULTISPECIES: reverse transcriptase domain-containing protein [unclassified Ensifer]|uniref:reverse transcriptase domain-containing protein n=1 Tax=unclassified Ensifer TaxID=2633371 RepID=UPI0008137DAC|nr:MULTISPECIES: reverse transcriptase domain-containing protein [unclassified Ensifer]OCP01814.1 hypothetical protein BC362_21645 [Ensifer sp. LC14]OCP04553.1 hypothetical protein BBX50_24990 [Ensifer sp. LC11]OCP09603.1 hypothetical protein BC374_03385 [Ensifer sp. LC13]OCP30650.1 hypothetical protein BC364_24675 [Ensifer sp. LC499]